MILARFGAGWQRAARTGAALVMIALVVAWPVPAGADPPGPTDYRSRVLGTSPPVEGVDARIAGGDSFLVLSVEPGTEVVVIGYRGEPYLAFRDDRTVEENESSPSTYLNRDRYGAVDPPERADPDADPVWSEVASDGTYAWHDHRSHWMNQARPFGAEPGDVILEAVVPIRVDGREVSLEVRSRLLARPSVVPGIVGALLGLAVGIGAVVLAIRRRRPGLIAAVAATVAVPATAFGVIAYRSVPPETGPPIIGWLLPATALAVGALGWWLGARGAATRWITALAALAGAELAIWGYQGRQGLWRALIPTDAPLWADRLIVAAGLTAGAVAACAATAWLLRSAGLLPVRAGRPQRSPSARRPPRTAE